MRTGGYAYAYKSPYGSPSAVDYPARSGSGGVPSPTAGLYGTALSGLYAGRSTSPLSGHAGHQGSPLKERPGGYASAAAAVGRTSPLGLERDYPRYATPPKSPYERAGSGAPLRERPGSILSENPYSLGATSYKSGVGGGYGSGLAGLSTPTKQIASHTSFNSGVYGVAGTPTSAQRYGSPAAGTPRGQRIRGTSFREDYSGLSPRSRMRRAPSMLGQPGTMMIPPQAPSDYGKYSIVLDLDETLIYARDGPLYARPGVEELFDYIGHETEAIAWTAGLRAYAQAVLANIDKNGAIKHCIYRHSKWFTGQAGYQKELTLLGRPLDRTLIIENTPDCIRANRENGVLVQDYEGGEMPDHTIPRLLEFIKGLVQSGEPVPQYLARCPMLSRRRVATDKGDYIECYWLEVHQTAAPSSPRYNRDLGVEQRFAYRN